MRDVVRAAADEVFGGVCDLEFSWALFVAAVAWSGDTVCGFSCGIVLSKSSARRSFEKVRFASSALASQRVQFLGAVGGMDCLLTLLKMKLPMGCAFLLPRRRGWGPILMKKTEAGLQVLTRSSGYESGSKRTSEYVNRCSEWDV